MIEVVGLLFLAMAEPSPNPFAAYQAATPGAVHLLSSYGRTGKGVAASLTIAGEDGPGTRREINR